MIVTVGGTKSLSYLAKVLNNGGIIIAHCIEQIFELHHLQTARQ
jgi:hypothetical protein